MIVAALVMGASMPKASKEVPINNETLIESTQKDNDNINDTVSKQETQVVKEDTTPDVETSSASTEAEKQPEVVSTEPEVETEVAAPEVDPAPAPNPEPAPEPETSVVSEETSELSGEIFTLKIIPGDDSVSVSRRLFEAGLIDSVSSFDDYLCENRYDRFIHVGTYDISVGAGYEKIAKIITRRDYDE